MENENSEAEALAREKIRNMLLNKQKVKVDRTGKLVSEDDPASQNAINVPDGDLA